MNDYDRFARLYDLEHQGFADDLDLYRNFALRCDGSVLELGCGSGRVCLALARSGFDITGVDTSEAMLDLAHVHVASAGLSGRVRLEQADIRGLAFEGQFALVIYPLNGFLHLLTVEGQLAALKCARRALLPGGFLIVDLPNPHVAFAPDADGAFLLRRRFASPEGHTIASLSLSQTDFARQRQHLTLRYDELDGDELIRRTTVETDLRFVYRYEMEALLRQAGLQIDAVYGSYDLDVYETNSDIMLFVAYRPLADDG
jgi:SAM-dependent methyltransferase